MSKESNLSPWDRRPWPNGGDTDENKLYASVGRALSAWERYEAQLAFLFAQFVAGAVVNPAIRAYCAIRTFEGRKEMLKSASASYFHGFGISADHKLVLDFKSILRCAAKFSERRNDIAHGVVDRFIVKGATPAAIIQIVGQYALFPTYGSAQARDQAGIPEYCYTSDELNYFSEQFFALHKPVHELAAEIYVTKSAMNRPMNASQRTTPPPTHK